MMAADCLEALGIKRGDYVIKVNNRKVLDGVMETIGLGGETNAGRRLTVMRAIDKLDRLGGHGVYDLLTSGRKDESGDFTKGAGLDEDQASRVLNLFAKQPVLADEEGTTLYQPGDNPRETEAIVGSNNDVLENVSAPFKLDSNDQLKEGLAELREIARLVEASDYGFNRVRIDPSVVRGLEYYTGPVFEAELTFEVKDDDGRTVRFGAVGGGGRYDGLVARFRTEPVPATALDRRLAPARGAARDQEPDRRIGRDDRPRRRARARPRRGLDGELSTARREPAQGRDRGRTLFGFGRHERSAQICGPAQEPRRRHQGGNERDAAGGPQVTIRDLKLGAELGKTTKDRADYLELRQRAQFSAPEGELVERVREVFARR